MCVRVCECVEETQRERDRRKERDRVDGYLFSNSFDLYGLEMKPIAWLRTNKATLLHSKSLSSSLCVVACALIVPWTPTDASARRPKGKNGPVEPEWKSSRLRVHKLCPVCWVSAKPVGSCVLTRFKTRRDVRVSDAASFIGLPSDRKSCDGTWIVNSHFFWFFCDLRFKISSFSFFVFLLCFYKAACWHFWFGFFIWNVPHTSVWVWVS